MQLRMGVVQIKYDDNKDIALTIVVPTYNEKLNVRPLVSLLDKALVDINWEVVFVDDDSPDGTADEVRELARTRLDVRVIHRIGRRGLSGACIEGILSSAAPYVAVMDGDLQHDETVLISMIASFNADPELNLVIGSRNVEGGSSGNGLSGIRSFGSDMATVMARKLLKIRVQDPMSGFFMIKLESFRDVVGELQRQGFKILTDLLSASRGSWKIKEIPFVFKERQYGQSKMDSAVTLEYFGLILARLTGGAISIRFVLFLFVGLTGILVQLLMVGIFLNVMFLSFFYSQILAVILAMTSNFFLNNILTYRDQSLSGKYILFGLLSFYFVCSLGAVANVAVANLVYNFVPLWILASFFGSVISSLWNFMSSKWLTWRVR
ncbi:glycosyltransferase family 2 protein [Paracoccaceae bacterium]|jgi:dolichol-phosphate mannosyltransferase|nr:glycosyltransferase family 2 protein [Paracoccaceae bacterium]